VSVPVGFARPFVTSVLVAGTTLAQLRSNIAAATLTLSTEVVAAIEKIHRDHPNPAP